MNAQIITVSQEWVIDNAISVIVAFTILLVGWYLSGFLSREVCKLLPRTGRIDSTVTPLISQLVRYGVLLVTLVVVLSQFGVQTASILAVLGAAGLAIALALQGTLSNLAAGLMLIWLRPFSVGEAIDAEGTGGSIVEIGLFATRMRTYDGVFVFVPNSVLWSARMTNWSREPKRMVELKFAISYRVDFEAASAVLLDIAKDERVLTDPPPFVFIDSFGEIGVSIGFRVWAAGSAWWDLRCAFLAAIKRRFDAEGLEFAYRKNDVMVPYDPELAGKLPPPMPSNSAPGNAERANGAGPQ